MAPVLSKLPPSDAQSSGRTLSQLLTRHSSPASLTQLTDDSLLVLLSFLPLSHLLSQIPLTCKRIHALLPLVFRRRRSLLLHMYSFLPPFNESYFGFRFKLQSVSPDVYASYLGSLFDVTVETPSYVRASNPPDATIQVATHCPFTRCLTDHFPNLTHLFVMRVELLHAHLLHLLKAYQTQLKSLALRYIRFLNPSSRGSLLVNLTELYDTLWPIINSMSRLRRLALGLEGKAPKLAQVLSNVLPRLTALTLDASRVEDLPSILRQMKRESVTHLHLTHWSQIEPFFFESKKAPTFGRALIHLTLSSCLGLNGGVTLHLLQAIVNNCGHLQSFDMLVESSIQFDRLLPHLVKLARLTSLGLKSKNWDFFKTYPEGGFPLAPLPTLSGLSLLDLEVTLNPSSFAILPTVCPNLTKLYLDKSRLINQINMNDMLTPNNVFSLYRVTLHRELLERPGTRQQMRQIIQILHSFAFLPKIKSNLN